MDEEYLARINEGRGSMRKKVPFEESPTMPDEASFPIILPSEYGTANFGNPDGTNGIIVAVGRTEKGYHVQIQKYDKSVCSPDRVLDLSFEGPSLDDIVMQDAKDRIRRLD